MSILHLRSILLVFLLWLAGLGAAAQFAKIAVPFSAFQALYPEVGPGIGWILSIVSIVGAVFGLSAGIVVARFGYVRLLISGLLVGAVMSLWQAQLPGFPAMLISRMIEGVSQLIIVVVAPTLIAQFSADRFRGAAMALWSTFFGVSFAVVTWIGLPFMAAYGLGGLLVAHAAYMAIMACVLAVAFRVFAVQLPPPEHPLGAVSFVRQHIDAYRSPNISAPAIGWFFYTLTFVALLALIPTTLPAGAGIGMVGVLPLISIGTALVGVSLLLNVTTATNIVIAGFGLAVAVVLFGVFGLPATYAWTGLFAVLGLIQGASFAAIVQLSSSAEDRALANGAMAQTGNLGNVLGTPVLLAVLSVFGVAGMLITVCGLYVMGGLAHVFLALKRRK